MTRITIKIHYQQGYLFIPIFQLKNVDSAE